MSADTGHRDRFCTECDCPESPWDDDIETVSAVCGLCERTFTIDYCRDCLTVGVTDYPWCQTCAEGEG